MILHRVGPGPGALAAPGISREIAGAGHEVEVILEPYARRFVGPAAFPGEVRLVGEPSEAPEAILFAPASAATVSRLARGLGVGVAGARFFLVAPDLDASTAGHPAVKENLALLREEGYRIVVGADGSMAPVGEVVAGLLGGLGGPLSGLRLLVSAGGTHEPMDSVRFIGNRSSGKMGLALAREALRLGA
ncbi:MAG TPA: phosphopantothenoylcysteine decarboxylase, partial [Rubrobacteraceae bacterium]